jgi:phosphate transport system protein
MRDAYHEELDSIGDVLVDMAGLVGSAMARATSAVLEADLSLAESVIAADDAVDALQREVDRRATDLLVRQQPVAGDLRMIVSSLRMTADLERMGDLARHVAKVARRRYPDSAIPPELHSTIAKMGQIAELLVDRVRAILIDRDARAAAALESEDDAMDRLHRGLFTALLDESWKHGVETAVDVTLCGRYYERFADHAVSVAKRMVFQVTGVRDAVPEDFD